MTTDVQSSSKICQSLKECFQSIVQTNQINVDIDSLKSIINSDLGITTNTLDSRLAESLPYMLISFIKVWPGWKKSVDYINHKLTLDEWYDKFKQYVIFKINYVIKTGFQMALDEIKQEEELKKACSFLSDQVLGASETTKSHVQTEVETSTVGRDLAPFVLEIYGPPKLLNTLIFTDLGGDVIVKQHTEKQWKPISHRQLLNWPHVLMKFKISELVFTKKFCPDIVRHVTLTDDKTSYPVNSITDKATTLYDPLLPRERFFVSVLKDYLKQYGDIMNNWNDTYQRVTHEKLKEIFVILESFEEDLSDIGKESAGSVTTNTRIFFNMGGCRYIRNKKINITRKIGENPPIGYCELIRPKCEIIIEKFTSSFRTNLGVRLFSYLESLKAISFASTDQDMLTFQKALPTIEYGCTYCNKFFSGSLALDKIMEHYEKEHKMEHPILCYDCKKQFDVPALASCRWYHTCSVRNRN